MAVPAPVAAEKLVTVTMEDIKATNVRSGVAHRFFRIFLIIIFLCLGFAQVLLGRGCSCD